MGQVYKLPYASISQANCFSTGMVAAYMEKSSTSQWNPGKALVNVDEVYMAAYPSATVQNQLCYVLGSTVLFSLATGIWDSVSNSNLYYNTYTIDGDHLGIGCPYSSRITFTGNSSWGETPHFPGALNYYSTEADAVDAIVSVVGPGPAPINTITYRLTNCTAPAAPEQAESGSLVTVHLTPDSGYAFINPSSDIYVTNNGVAVVSSYANGVLHFTMP